MWHVARVSLFSVMMTSACADDVGRDEEAVRRSSLDGQTVFRDYTFGDEQHWTIHPAQGVAAQRHHDFGPFRLQLESHFRAGAHQLRTHFKWQAIEASFSENPVEKAPHAVFEIAVLEG